MDFIISPSELTEIIVIRSRGSDFLADMARTQRTTHELLRTWVSRLLRDAQRGRQGDMV